MQHSISGVNTSALHALLGQHPKRFQVPKAAVRPQAYWSMQLLAVSSIWIYLLHPNWLAISSLWWITAFACRRKRQEGL